jgi:hypothetical protein
VRNLALDDELDGPHTDLVPQHGQLVRIELPTKAYQLAKGHKLRLALSRTYWPLAFPAVEQGPVSLSLLESVVRLSTAPTELHELTAALPDVTDEIHTPPTHTVYAAPLVRNGVTDIGGKSHRGWHQQQSTVEYHPINISIATECKATYELHTKGDANACCTIEYSMKIVRADGTASIQSTASVQLLRGGWQLKSYMRVDWNNEVLLDKSVTEDIAV